jgi:ribosome-binding protein aMBF1 (putative translation factor)
MIGEQLRVAIQEAIWKRGITQRELAHAIELHEAMVSRFLKGEREASFDTIDKILDVLGLEIVVRARRNATKGD